MNLRRALQWLEVPFEGGTHTNRWINNDIKPIERARRTWGFWSFHNLWVLTNMNISTYLTGSSLIALGLTWWQALISIVVGSLLTACFVVLNSTAGSFYHIGFPVANRYTWGMYGSSFVIYNRILLSLVWYAVQAWIGGECVYVCLQAIWPSIESRIPNHMPASTGMTTAQFVAYIVFMVISLPLIYIRPHKFRYFFYVAVAICLAFEVALLIWALATMGPSGFGATISGTTAITRSDSIGWLVMYGIISTIGSISAGILNQNDYARFATRPRDAIYGQLASVATYSIFSSVTGILVTAATQQRFGSALWNLPDLFSALITNGGPRSRAASFFAGIALVVSQWGINIPGNALSGGFDLAATFPRYVNIRRGAYITALLSMAVNPWQILATASTFLAVMSAYSVFLGPMVGVMVCGYYIVHRQKINVDDLFISGREGLYWYTCGVNWRALVAWICGVFPAMPGFVANVNPSVTVMQGWTRIFYINFITGFVISGVIFVGLHWLFPDVEQKLFADSQTTWREVVDHYREKWDEAADNSGKESPDLQPATADEPKDRVAVSEIPSTV